jgi:hypothetical protein
MLRAFARHFHRSSNSRRKEEGNANALHVVLADWNPNSDYHHFLAGDRPRLTRNVW